MKPVRPGPNKRKFTCLPVVLFVMIVLFGCDAEQSVNEEPKQRCRIGFSVGFDLDSVKIFRGSTLMYKNLATTNWSVGRACNYEMNYEYGLYKVIVSDSDTLQVNISEQFPIAYVFKDSLGIGVEYFDTDVPAY